MVSVIKFVDPRIDESTLGERIYSVFQGGSSISYRHWTAMSHNASQTQWYLNVADNLYSGRRWFVAYTVRVQFAAAKVANANTASGNWGLRAFPLASITLNVALSPGNDTINNPVSNNIHALMHYGSSPDERNRWMSGFPSYMDQNQTYAIGPMLLHQVYSLVLEIHFPCIPATTWKCPATPTAGVLMGQMMLELHSLPGIRV